jgi:hypothetical protein
MTTDNATTFNATTFIGFRLRLNGPGADKSAPYAGLPSMTPARMGNVIRSSAWVPAFGGMTNATPAPCQSGSGLFTLYLINQTIKSSD